MPGSDTRNNIGRATASCENDTAIDGYRATASAPAPIDDTTAAALGESEKAAKPTQAAAAKARTKAADEPRTPMDIPSLYID